jgi:hypothetical protein
VLAKVVFAIVFLSVVGCSTKNSDSAKLNSDPSLAVSRGAESGLAKANTLQDISTYVTNLNQNGRVIQAIPGLNQMKGPIFQDGSIVASPNPDRLACKLFRITGSRPSDDVISAQDRFTIKFGGSDATVSPASIYFSLEFLTGASGYKSYTLHCYSSNANLLTGSEIVKATANYLVIP